MCRWWDRTIQRVFGEGAPEKELCEWELGGRISGSGEEGWCSAVGAAWELLRSGSALRTQQKRAVAASANVAGIVLPVLLGGSVLYGDLR